ncbi:FAD:protein FMN transferase [Sphingomonas sp. 1P08PE]|uniref:FAD:protein FMN transferase n=1 Tax=Sphingomonas sp. 1P08PE TaxID=554122 RepID=UPI0039A064C1
MASGVGTVERFAAMGTRVELHAFGSLPEQADLLAAARRAVEAVDDALTIHRPSPTTALNEALMAGEPAAIDDPLLFDALVLVDEGHAATLELFDVAADARRGGSWRWVTFDREMRRICAEAPLALDFGGMGKGFALDRAATLLRAGGVGSALLSAGESSIVVVGAHPLGGGWPFAIPHPLMEREQLVEVELHDEALSVSASVGAGTLAPERAATIRPHDAHAVIAPRCTVAIAPTGAAAEMASTALMAADPVRARRLLHTAPNGRFRFELGAASPARPTRMCA